MLEVNVRLFGAFRDWSERPAIRLECAPGTSLLELRQAMQTQLEVLRPGAGAADLLKKSVFANEHAVLNEDFRLEQSLELAIIPPVCGG